MLKSTNEYSLETFTRQSNMLTIHNLLMDMNISKAIEKLSEITCNPVMLLDYEHKLIEAPLTEPINSHVWMHSISLGYYDPDMIDEDFYRIVKELTTQSTPVFSVVDGYPCAMCSISHDKEYYGFLAILAYNKPYTEADLELMEFTCKNLLACYQRQFIIPVSKTYQISFLLSDIICRKLRSPEELYSGIKIRNWNPADSHLLYVIDTRDFSTEYIQYLGKRFMTLSPGIISFQNEMYLLVFTDCHSVNISLVSSLIEHFIQQFSLYCGVSEIFENLLSLPTQYENAKQALLLNRILNTPANYICHYKNIKFDDMIFQFLKSTNYKNYIHETILQLQEYDSINHTELNITLYHYLKADKSVNITSTNMHVHKNTISYRISKIKEVTSLDFKDTSTLIHIYFSYVLLNYSKMFEDIL